MKKENENKMPINRVFLRLASIKNNKISGSSKRKVGSCHQLLKKLILSLWGVWII